MITRLFRGVITSPPSPPELRDRRFPFYKNTVPLRRPSLECEAEDDQIFGHCFIIKTIFCHEGFMQFRTILMKYIA
jgi:hypothetical protein